MPMDDMDRPPSDEPSAEDAFALVSHELRTEILRVLGAQGETGVLSFSALRDRMEADVDPSQLHYHIQQLEGTFLENTDDGYRLRPAGIRLTMALYAGTFDPRRAREPVDAELDCHHCGAPVEATFDPIGVKIACTDCERAYDWIFLTVPIEAFEDARGGFSWGHFREYIAIRNLFLGRGICPGCANPLTPELHTGEDHPGKVCIHQKCGLCGAVWTMSVGQALLADPAFVAFCSDHDVDVHSTPYWEFEFAETDTALTVRSVDPIEVALEVTIEGETLVLVVDEALTVTDRNRFEAIDESDGSAASCITAGSAGQPTRSDGQPTPTDGPPTPAEGEVSLPDNRDCLRAVREARWPNGVTCVYCASNEITKDGTTSKDAQRYTCHACTRSFNDLTNSVFAERGLSLPEMFHVVRSMDEHETTRIARQLDRSYNTILDFVHEVRDARDGDSGFDPSAAVGR